MPTLADLVICTAPLPSSRYPATNSNTADSFFRILISAQQPNRPKRKSRLVGLHSISAIG